MRAPLNILYALLTGTSAFSVPAQQPARGDSVSASFAADTSDVIRSFTLYENSGDDNIRRCIGRCDEIRPLPRDANAEEDEVEMFYVTKDRSFMFPHSWVDDVEVLGLNQTSNRSFLFPRSGWDGSTEAMRLLSADAIAKERVNIRQTSFGCGRLGHSVWPSGIALASLLSGDGKGMVKGRRVLELGSGCGLPSLVARDVCDASDILATDYWEEEGGKFDADRLVPKNLFGTNLAHNLRSETAVARLDWHDQMGVIYTADQFRPDLIIGSDLVYYPSDTPPLIKTLNILLKSSANDALLILPLPPNTEREALPEFRSLLESGEIDGCEVKMDELLMLGCTEEDRHNLLRIHIKKI